MALPGLDIIFNFNLRSDLVLLLLVLEPSGSNYSPRPKRDVNPFRIFRSNSSEDLAFMRCCEFRVAQRGQIRAIRKNFHRIDLSPSFSDQRG
jgi:hypothetical protein